MDIRNYISSGIIELYVMGLCSPEEERELEQLRKQHPELHEAIMQYESEMESKMLQKGTLPAADVDEKILQRLEALNTPVLQMKTAGTPVKKMFWLKPVAAAVLLLLGISVFFNYRLSKKNKLQAEIIKGSKNISLPLSDYEVITNPSITPVGMYGVGSHAICRCTMFWDKKTGKAYIIIHHLPKSSSSKDYQLWAEVDGKPVSVGIINDEIRGRFIEVPNVPSGAIAFTVTLERAGGNNTPTVDETYLKGGI
ncbi:MAG: anti-sigma factor [Bacteroidota bacterium]